jgi:hypothetical protein
LEIFWIFFGIYLEFFERIFWEEVFGWIFCGGFFVEDFFGRIFLGEIFWEDFFGRNFWEEFFVYLVKVS